jgi:hypothetical protein
MPCARQLQRQHQLQHQHQHLQNPKRQNQPKLSLFDGVPTQHTKRVRTKMKDHLFEAEEYAEKRILAIAFVSRTVDAVHESYLHNTGAEDGFANGTLGAAFKPWQSDPRLRDTFKEEFHAETASAKNWHSSNIPGEHYFLSLLNVFESKLVHAASLVLGNAATAFVIALRQRQKN